MPESLLSRRLKLGTYLGIGLYVHWSFALILAYVAISASGGGPVAVAFVVAQLLSVFFCVTLHEYGHAMAARRFGIGTADITLLPIGGVARLQRMPRIPWQELVVAVAGPAVNVVIATLVLLGLVLFADPSILNALTGLLFHWLVGTDLDDAMLETLAVLFTVPSLAGFTVFLLVANSVLVAFNMIPAFPMDGGRVFRSLLAMTMDYRRATTIASRVGLVCAALIAVIWLQNNPSNPIPVLIAAFVGYAGISEARQVDVMESVRGLTAGQVMIRSDIALPMDMPLAEIARRWQSLSVAALPVISIHGPVIGMLYLRDLAQAVADGTSPTTTAGELIDHGKSPGTIRAEEELASALIRTGKQRRQIPVVDDEGYLVGVLDLDTMLARGELSKSGNANLREEVGGQFDQRT